MFLRVSKYPPNAIFRNALRSIYILANIKITFCGSCTVQRARIAHKNARGYVFFAAVYFAFSFVVVKPIQSKQVEVNLAVMVVVAVRRAVNVLNVSTCYIIRGYIIFLRIVHMKTL